MGIFKRRHCQSRQHQPHVTEWIELVGGPSDGAVVPMARHEDCQLVEMSWPHRYGISWYRRRGTPACAAVAYRGGEFRLEAKFDYAGELQ